MNRSRVFKFHSLEFFRTISQNRSFLSMVLVYAFGLLIGCIISVYKTDILKISEGLFSVYLSNRSDSSFIKLFLKIFWSYLPVQLLCFLCGTSIVGIVVVPLISAFSGFSFGITAGYMYSSFSLKGIAFNGLMFIPSHALSALCLLLCAKEALQFSGLLIHSSLPGSPGMNYYNNFKNYCLKNIIYLGLLLFAALLDAAESSTLLRLFSF